MECSHTKSRALSVTQPEQNTAETGQSPFRAVRSVSTEQLTTNGNTVTVTGMAAGVSASELTPAAKSDKKKAKRSASFLGLTRVPSFLRSSTSQLKPEVPELKGQLISTKTIKKKLTRRPVSVNIPELSQSSPTLLNPLPSNQSQRQRMLALPLEESAASSSSASSSSASASARLLPPRQEYHTWQDLFLAAKKASTACDPKETLTEVPNAFLEPWNTSLNIYIDHIKSAVQNFIGLSKDNIENNDAALLRQCLEKTIELGKNIHPFLFALTYKLEFCRHAFSQQEVKGLFCFLKEELKTFENKKSPLTEYQKIINYLDSYLNLICKTDTEKKEVKIPTLKLVRSRSFKTSLIISNPSPDSYIPPIYLNNGTVLAMRRYSAMNRAFLAGFSKVNTNLVITTEETELIKKIIEKNINAVTDVVLLFTTKNSTNHYGNFLNKALDSYYQSIKVIPKNLKNGKIQKLVKIMLAKLIDEALDVSHLGECLKSPFHLAKDGFGREDYELQRQNPDLAAIVVKFQRAFMENLLNDLAHLRITQSAPVSEKAAEPSLKKITVSEKTLTQGFNQIISYFAKGDLETLLATDAQVHWEKIKAELKKH